MDLAHENEQITGLLVRWQEGDSEALDHVMEAAFDELFKIAQGKMKQERPAHTLGAGGLINEAWMKLRTISNMQFNDRQHFFCAVARIMTRILCNYGRDKGRQKRGGNNMDESLDLYMDLLTAPTDEAYFELVMSLKQLSDDPQIAQILILKVVLNGTQQEVAAQLRLSVSTVKRKLAIGLTKLGKILGGDPS